MPDQRMIGEILSERRRSLGLSVDRVVADTKLQRRMVEAFEDSDFDEMPPRGYARASLSSYARYLDLDPKEILRVYEDQLYDYQQESAETRRPAARNRYGREPHGRFDDGYDREGRRDRSARDRRDRSYEDGYDGDDYPGGRRRDTARADSRDFRRDRDREYGRGGRSGVYPDGPDGDSRSRGRTYPDREGDRGGSRGERSYAASGSTRVRERSSSGWPDEDRGGSHAYGYGTARGSGEAGRDTYWSSSRSAGRGYSDRYRTDRGSGTQRSAEYGASRPPTRDDRPAETSRGRDRRPQRDQQRVRRTQFVTLDDGYQGGSGGPEHEDDYRPARQGRPERQSMRDILRGVADTVRNDRRMSAVVIGSVAVALVVLIAIPVSSCVLRGSQDSTADGRVPVTAVEPELTSSVDLDAIPSGSVLRVEVASDVTTAPWIEITVDGTSVYASISQGGTVVEYTIASTATVKLSSSTGVTISINGTAVVATPENGIYTLTANVAQDAQV